MDNFKKHLPKILIAAVSLFFIIAIIGVYSEINRKKKALKEAEASITASYATNPTKAPETETQPSETYETVHRETTVETMATNFAVDEHIYDEDLTYNTIAINNQKITFPCSYETLTEHFTLYNSILVNGENVPFDGYFSEGKAEVCAYPDETVGCVIFTLYGNSINDAVCYEVEIMGINYNSDKQSISTVFANGLTFGMPSGEITKRYPFTQTRNSLLQNSFYICLEDGTNKFEFYGKDNILNHVKFTYGKENTAV